MGRISCALFYSVVLLVLASAENASAQWTQARGLDNVVVSCISAAGTDLYAGTSEGVFRSTDRGENWFTVNSGLLDTRVQALASIDTVVYAGTLQGIFRSTDHGSSWTAAGFGLPNSAIRSLTSKDNVLVAGTLDGIFRSTDRGVSWAGAAAGLAGSPAYTISASGNSLLAGAGNAVYRSDDLGIHWSQVNNTTTATVGTASAQVSFVFDDSHPTQYSALKPIFTKHNVPAVIAVITDKINTPEGITAEHLREVEGYGWELASHTVHHFKLTTVSSDSMAWELRESKRIMTDYGLKTPETIVYPGGDENKEVMDTAAHYYSAGVVSWDGLNKWTAPRMQILRVDADDSYSLAKCEHLVDSAMATGVWCVFMVHEVDSVEQQVMLDSLITYIQSKEVPIVTIQQGLVSVTSFAAADSEVFAGTSDGVVRMGSDFTRWQVMDNGPFNYRRIVSSLVASESRLYAANRQGVYVSTDKATSWTLMNNGLANTFVTSLYTAGNTLFGGTYGSGIWKYALPVQNHAPLQATQLRPALTDTVQLLSGSVQPVRFHWQQAPDPDRDSLSFRLRLVGASLDTTVAGLRDTMVALALPALQPGQTYAWAVETTDGRVQVVSDTARFRTVLLVQNHAPVAAARLRPGLLDTVQLVVDLAQLSSGSPQPVSVRFHWGQAPDPDLDTLSYRIHLWGASLDTTVTSLRDTVVALALPTLQAGQTYAWTVETSDGHARVLSDTTRFRTAAVVQNHAPLAASRLRPGLLDTVLISSSSQPVRFHWQQAADPDRDSLSYRLHLWGASLDTTVSGLRDTVVALVLPAVKPGQMYSWTVETSDGKARVASDTARFNTAQFIQNHAPLAASRLRPGAVDTLGLCDTLQPVQFHWQQAPDADRDTLSYRLHLWGTALDTTVTGLRDTAVALALPALEPGQMYSWTVETSDGKARVASDTARFHTVLVVLNHAPEAAARLRPSSNDTVQLYGSMQPVRFHWQQAADPDRDSLSYRLHLWGASLDTTVSGLRDTVVALVLPAMKPGEMYAWTVETSDAKLSAASDTMHFRTANTILGVKGSTWGLPETMALEQNYPNPFNPSTTIRYALPQSSHVTLIVYNALGQQVAELVNGDISAGYHEVRFTANNLASGIYFYRFEAGSFVQIRRSVLVK